MDAAVRFSNAQRRRQVVARAIIGGLLLVLSSCQIPNLRPPDPGPPLPASFAGVTSPDNSAQLRVEDFFTDPVLVKLIHQALAGNQELKILAQDVQIAQNEILFRTGAYLPLVSLRGGAGFDKSSRFTRNGAVDEALDIRPGKRIPNPLPDFLVAAEFTWQVDIWRKLRNARDAAALRYLATADGRNYVVTRMVAEVAENYYGLVALDKRLEVLDQTIALQERSLEVAQSRFDAGRGTELAVQRFRAEVRKNQSERLIVRQEIIETENRINFLAGRYPQPVERVSTDFIDLNLHALSVGVPAQLLRNRPDVRQAERELEAAGLDVKTARAEFFPALDITGGLGYEAFNPKYLFNPEAFVANVAGNLVTPLVNRRAIQAVFGTANARQLQTLYNYQRVVLDAYTEVVNRVSMAENYRRSIQIKRQQLQALEASVDVASKLFMAARVEYIEVLFAQRDLLEARTVLIDTKRQQLSAVVNAYQALGGGGYLSPAFTTQPPPSYLYRLFRKVKAMAGGGSPDHGVGPSYLPVDPGNNPPVVGPPVGGPPVGGPLDQLPPQAAPLAPPRPLPAPPAPGGPNAPAGGGRPPEPAQAAPPGGERREIPPQP